MVWRLHWICMVRMHRLLNSMRGLYWDSPEPLALSPLVHTELHNTMALPTAGWFLYGHVSCVCLSTMAHQGEHWPIHRCKVMAQPCIQYVRMYYNHCTTGQWNHILQCPCWNHAQRYIQITTGGYRSCTHSLTHLPGVQIPLGQPTGIR